MDNSFAIRKGFTLLELTAVMMIVGILLTTVISNGINYINRAKFQATVREMGSIAQSAIDYYNSHASTWPSDLAALSNNINPDDNNMPQVVNSNPFNISGYQLSFANNSVTVSTMIPKGILIDPNEGSFLIVNPGTAADQISITQSIPNEFSGRLIYDLKYLYK